MSYHLSVSFPSPGRGQSCVEVCDVDKLILDLCHNPPPPALWPCSLSLRGIALQWISNTCYQQKTHSLSLWHTFCAYFPWPAYAHTQHNSHRGLPPTHTHTHTHTSRRECFMHWLPNWAATEERDAGGRREMQTVRDRGITDRSRLRPIYRRRRDKARRGTEEETHSVNTYWWREQGRKGNAEIGRETGLVQQRGREWIVVKEAGGGLMGWHWSLGAAGSWARWRLVAADRCSTLPAVDRSSKSASPPSQVGPSLLSVLPQYCHDTDPCAQIDRSVGLCVYTTWVTHLAKKVNRAWCVTVP